MTFKSTTIAALVLLAGSSVASAQSCDVNFKQDGVPLLTDIIYRSWRIYPTLDAGLALDNLASAVAAEGYVAIRVDRQLRAISALQETSGSGRPQTLRISARKSGKGTRVDGIFTIQAGQIASADAVREGLCAIIDAAR